MAASCFLHPVGECTRVGSHRPPVTSHDLRAGQLTNAVKRPCAGIVAGPDVDVQLRGADRAGSFVPNSERLVARARAQGQASAVETAYAHRIDDLLAVVAPSAGEEAPPVDRLGAIVPADAPPGDVAAPPPDEQPASAAKNTVTKTNAPERRDVMTRMLGPHRA